MASNEQASGSIMSPPNPDLLPPKDDPFTASELAAYNGATRETPIYVAIKGTVFDVSNRRDTYGPGRSYHCFTGKDASRALGKSSLKEEDLSADYSVLDEQQLKVLDDWYSFFSKRYNVVGKVVEETQSISAE